MAKNSVLKNVIGEELHPKTSMEQVDGLIDKLTSIEDNVNAKQEALVSGVNIRTINGNTLLGNGDLVITGGDEPVDLSGYVRTEDLTSAVDNVTSFVNSELQVVNLNISQNVSAIESLNSKTDDTDSELNLIKSDYGYRIDTLETNKAENSAVSELQTYVDTVNGDVSVMRNDIATLQGQISENKTEIQMNEESITGHSTRLDGLDSEITILRGELSNLSQEYYNTITTKTTLEDVTSTVSQMTSPLQDSIQSLETNKQNTLTTAGPYVSIQNDMVTVEIPDVGPSSPGLMSSDDKIKLDGIENGAQVNKIEEIQVDGSSVQIDGTVAKINMDKYATKEDVSAIVSFDAKVVSMLPTAGMVEKTIYLVPKSESDSDVYNEYLYINGKWELIGSTAVDLSDYYTISQIDTKITHLDDRIDTEVETIDSKLSNKQDTLKAGANVTISGNTISAENTEYPVVSANGNGLMSTEMLSKLESIESNATRVIVDSALNANSTNAVENKAVTLALNDKLQKTGTASRATADANGNTITTTYETKANAITGLSVSGKTITYTKGSGNTGTIDTLSYSVGTGLTMDGTKISHGNYVTAGTVGGDWAIPVISYNAQGHIISVETFPIPKITISKDAPTGGSHGDIWYQYE